MHALLICTPIAACGRGTPRGGTADDIAAAPTVIALPLDTIIPASLLDRLDRSIGDSRIVLLGENGHGVAEFTTLKGALVRHLHEKKGFDVFALESGFYECAQVGERLRSLTVSEAIRGCGAFAFEHAELQPLFRYLKGSLTASSPLALSGIDFQAQGADSRGRPEYLRSALRANGSPFAPAIARIDSTLLARNSVGTDSLRIWINENGRAAQAVYDSAAIAATGVAHWTLKGVSALLERLLVGSTAQSAAQPVPERFYGLRDEWMARTVQWLADSGGRPKKVVVWLHNDHARYGTWATPSGPTRATGALLNELFPGKVYSIGLFMGAGSVANNSRQERAMIAAPAGSIEHLMSQPGQAAGYSVLRNAAASPRWARQLVSYLRNGLAVDSMIPAQEFDAMLFVGNVHPATYRLP